MKIQFLLLLIALSLSSCSALKEAQKEIEQQRTVIEDLERQIEYAAPDRHASTSDRAAIRHIVFFQMNKGSDKNAWKKFYYLLKDLESIEYVTEFKLGKSLEEEYSAHMRTDYDMVMYMTFASEAHLAKYQKHELHLKIREASSEFISEVWSYDFTSI